MQQCRSLAVCAVTALVPLLGACAGVDEPTSVRALPEPIGEQAQIDLAESPANSSDLGTAKQPWSELTHVSVAGLAAQKWGLASSRVDTIGNAADDPDTYESGIENGFNQQWSHAYLHSALGFWMWGDANENFDDCLTGELAGQLEGPECKDGLSAWYYYWSGNQSLGDTYLGYAVHYIEDVSLVLHASDPTLALDMLTQHFNFENWVKNNWTAGHNFQATVAADNYYYAITNLQQSVRNAAWAGSYWNSSSAGRKAWNAYRSSGYPTGLGTGNAELVTNTKQMLIRASRYATGAIKYALDAYGEWAPEY
jgi:hypothetical protein